MTWTGKAAFLVLSLPLLLLFRSQDDTSSEFYHIAPLLNMKNYLKELLASNRNQTQHDDKNSRDRSGDQQERQYAFDLIWNQHRCKR